MKSDFRVGDCIVRPQLRLIERGDESFHIKPKPMSVFECLVAAKGAPVSRQELFDTVWPGAEVTDDVLTKCIAELRKAFGDSAKESRVIETIPKLGFRLVPAPEPIEPETLAAAQSSTVPKEPGRSYSRKLRIAGLLLVAVVLVFVALLSFDNSRSRLTETGVTLFIKAATVLAPQSVDPEPGMAVLPFVSLSVDPQDEYFSGGISAELINALARNDRLRIIAASSSFVFKGMDKDVREIGRLLGVTHVVGGSVRRTDNQIRLHAQLIDTATGELVWSGIYQRELSDIFALQNEIAKTISHQIYAVLGEKIVPVNSKRRPAEFMAAQPTSNLEAYELFVQGAQMVKSNSPGPREQAAGYFERAIALDEDYADAWAAKGFALYNLGRGGFGHSHIPASVYPQAIAAFRKALEIDPQHAFATGWLGVVLMYNDFKWAEGMQLIQKSLTLNPNDVELLTVYALYLDVMEIEGADRVIDMAFRLDPFGITPVALKASRLFNSGRTLEGASLMEVSLIQDRDGYAPNYYSAGYNLFIGRLELAEEFVNKARQTANPVDLSLDYMEWGIDTKRSKTPRVTKEEIMERMKKENLSYFVYGSMVGSTWKDEKEIVAALDLAIEQRQRELHGYLFDPKPSLVPEADWRRMKDITGVTKFQSDSSARRSIAQYVVDNYGE